MSGAPDRSMLAPHLAEPALLSYLDGELSQEEMFAARMHVAACWTCRRRLTLLEEQIASFVDAKAVIDPAQLAADGEQRVRQFRERLVRHSQELDAQRSFGEYIREHVFAAGSFLNLHRRAALASVVAMCVLAAMFTDALGTRVSAETVLARAERAQHNQTPHAGQVRRAALRVSRVEQSTGIETSLGTIMVLQDGDTGLGSISAVATSGKQGPAALASPEALNSALLAEELPAPLAHYLSSRHWLPSASIEAFRQILAGRASTTASLQKEAGVYTLVYPFAEGHPSGIAEARLRVDRTTYAAMGLSLFLAEDSNRTEYRFTPVETSYQPRTPEIASLFAAHTTIPAGRPTPPREPAKVVPLSYAATHATDEEVRLTAALHKADACMGEEIHVFPMSDGSLLVQGLVDKPERRDAIVQAIRSADPSLHSEIFLPRELKSGSQLFPLPYHAPEIPASARSNTTLAELSSERIPLYQQLFQHFSRPGVSPEDTDQQINAFSNEAVTLARESFLHAWALKKLDLQFPSQRMVGLSAEAVQQIEQMRQDHRRWIATLSRRQTEMLSQVTTLPKSGLGAEDSAAADSDTLVRLSREQNDLVRSLFTVSGGNSEAEANLTRLLSVLRRMGS
jgi:anti-sigma factor RsiW